MEPDNTPIEVQPVAEAEVAPPPTPAVEPAIISDIAPPVTAPPEEEDVAQAAPTPAPLPVQSSPAKAYKPKAARQPSVTGAIIATVIIVLGLAGLAVFAYLKTK